MSGTGMLVTAAAPNRPLWKSSKWCSLAFCMKKKNIRSWYLKRVDGRFIVILFNSDWLYLRFLFSETDCINRLTGPTCNCFTNANWTSTSLTKSSSNDMKKTFRYQNTCVLCFVPKREIHYQESQNSQNDELFYFG